MRKTTRSLLAAALLLAVTAGTASAHTEADVVAVPAGSEATITLAPTHGCGTSPTIEVAIQAPVAGAVAGEADGWTATASDDGDSTVLEWSGGLLPADQTGEFPVTFTAPSTPGELLLFPAIQYCEDGSTLEWISGDPTSDYPAPRILVLPADHEPASSIDAVAPDAPGREQLVEIIDVDGLGSDEGSEAETEDEEPEVAETTTTEAAPADPDGEAEDDAPDAATEADGSEGEDDGGSALPIVIGAVVILAAAAGAVLWARNRGSASDDG